MLRSISQALRTATLVLIACAVGAAFFALFYSSGSAPPEARVWTAAASLAVVVAFAVFVFIPMLPGLLEVRREADAQSLTIDQNYSRDPRYMGKSFRDKISTVLQSAPLHTRMPFLHRQKEFARVVPSLELGDDEAMNDAILCKGTVSTGHRASLVDLYAHGDVRVGPGSKLRALAADGEVQLGSSVFITRWIDAEKDIRVGPNSNLGHSVSAVGAIWLATNVRFARLCGNPIVVGDSHEQRPAPIVSGKWMSGGKRRMSTVSDTVGRGDAVEGDMISRGAIELLEGAIVKGSVKAGGDVIIGPKATIVGNVVARGDVVVHDGGAILGHVFAEGNVFMAKDSVVGAAGSAKTLYSSCDIQLADGSTVYGWVICEGIGSTVATITV